MTLEGLKLAAISAEFSDAEVERIFMRLDISDKKTLIEAWNILQRHRPKLLKAIERKYFSGPKFSD